MQRCWSVIPGRSAAMLYDVSSSVTECFQSVMDCLKSVGTPKNMAANLPAMTLQPLYTTCMRRGRGLV